MTAKIDWYREVLELEPNSKVFFPLARMLAQEGEKDEAIAILEKGLARHPEYLEARLCLIELLFQQNRRDECNEEVRKLSTMFSAYAGFWQAWAACLASDECQAETASIIRFLAAHFVSGPLKLHDVINKGLDAMLQEANGAGIGEHPEAGNSAGSANIEPESEPSPQIAGVPEAVADFEAHSEEMLEDLDAALDASGPREELAITGDDPNAEMVPAEETVADNFLLAEEAVAEEGATAGDSSINGFAETEATLSAAGTVQDDGEELAISEDDAPEDMLPVPDEAGTAVEREDASTVMDVPEADQPEELAITAEDPAAEMLPAEEDFQPEPLLDSQSLEVECAEGPMEENPVHAAAMEDEELAITADDPDADLLPAQDPMATLAEAVQNIVDAEELPEENEIAPDASMAEETPGAMGDAAEDMFAGEEPQPEVSPDEVANAEAAMLAEMDLPEMTPPAMEASVADAEIPEDEFMAEEQVSLRTRSMAEVLAEQGDIQGALEIYQELAAAATSADEAEDINRRIATLTSRLNLANASATYAGVDADAAARSKEKLIGMLEALAERVEARVQG